MSDLISVTINVDTRPGFLEAQSNTGKMSNGPRSIDFLTEGVINKKNFFKGFDTEVILFIDQHEPLPEETKAELFKLQETGVIKSLVFSKHERYFEENTIFPKWNDLNFLNALFLARGKYTCHFDADMTGFCNDPSVISEWIDWLETGKYKYVCYPSFWSPGAAIDPDFTYMWASTRFFFCKRETLQFDEITKCLKDEDYLYGKYGEKGRRCPWLEHILGIIDDGKVYYPKIELNRYIIFCFKNYTRGTLEQLNVLPYSEIEQWVCERFYEFPCDLSC